MGAGEGAPIRIGGRVAEKGVGVGAGAAVGVGVGAAIGRRMRMAGGLVSCAVTGAKATNAELASSIAPIANLVRMILTPNPIDPDSVSIVVF